MLLKMRKNIPKPIFILVLANKKTFFKKSRLLFLSFIKKETIIIS